MKSLREAAPTNHPFTITILRLSGQMYAASGRLDVAACLLREIITIERRMKLALDRSAVLMSTLAGMIDDEQQSDRLFQEAVGR